MNTDQFTELNIGDSIKRSNMLTCGCRILIVVNRSKHKLITEHDWSICRIKNRHSITFENCRFYEIYIKNYKIMLTI